MLKLYVLIRDDLPVAAQAVQAGHAIAQFGIEHPYEFANWQAEGNTLIYLSINRIEKWKTTLDDGDFIYSVFTEPEACCLGKGWHDWWFPDGVETAIAVAPNWYSQYLLFDDLPLAFTGALTAKKVQEKIEVAVRDERLQVTRAAREKKRWWQ